MYSDAPIDIDAVGSDNDSVASGSSCAKKRVGAPAKYVWQYFKRFKDPTGKEVRVNNRYHQVCLGCHMCFKSCEVVTAEDHLLNCKSAKDRVEGLRDIILKERAKEPTASAKMRKVDGKLPGMAGYLTSAPTDDQRKQWDKALFMFIVMCGVSFNAVDSPAVEDK
ncbi:TPA: hypothetical protein ACH3X1_001681 [Trebouxia sp. C0004]